MRQNITAVCVVWPPVSTVLKWLHLAMQFSFLLSYCNCLLCRLGNGSWLWDVGNAQTSALWDRKRKWGLNCAQAAQSACLSWNAHIFSTVADVQMRKWFQRSHQRWFWRLFMRIMNIFSPPQHIWTCLHTFNPQITGWLSMGQAKTSLIVKICLPSGRLFPFKVIRGINSCCWQ